MNPIEQYYEPYNFSATQCYVIKLAIKHPGSTKIEYKLPAYIKQLKGIYISLACTQQQVKIGGYISLNFNGNALKCFNNLVFVSKVLDDWSKPLPLNEQLKPNSFMQGYYFGFESLTDVQYSISIYLHYL